jgi:hypothetical protein
MRRMLFISRANPQKARPNTTSTLVKMVYSTAEAGQRNLQLANLSSGSHSGAAQKGSQRKGAAQILVAKLNALRYSSSA